MIMLDTNVCSYIIKGLSPWADNFLQSHDQEFCISSLVAFELEMWGLANPPEGALCQLIAAFLEEIPVIPFGKVDAKVGAKVSAKLLADKKRIGAIDPLIAAHAIARGVVLVTNNQKDFRHVEGLSYSVNL